MGIAVNAGDFCEGATTRRLVSSQENHSSNECLSAQTTLSAEVRGLIWSTEFPLYLVAGVFLRRGMRRFPRSASSYRSYSYSETPRLLSLLPVSTRAATMVRLYYTVF